jgi:hypothetical protein
MLALVFAAAKVSDSQDGQLGFAPRQAPAGHEAAGKGEPASEQPAVATNGQEKVGTVDAGRQTGHPSDHPQG